MEQPRNRLVILNYEELYKEANRLKIDQISLLNAIFFKPRNQREEQKKIACRLRGILLGNSFLLNPLGLINSTVDLAYKVMYLEAACLRSYSTYKQTKITYLELDMFPDLNMNLVAVNPLLKLEGNYALRFPLEEAVSTMKK